MVHLKFDQLSILPSMDSAGVFFALLQEFRVNMKDRSDLDNDDIGWQLRFVRRLKNYLNYHLRILCNDGSKIAQPAIGAPQQEVRGGPGRCLVVMLR